MTGTIDFDFALQPKQHQLWNLCEDPIIRWAGIGGSRSGGKSDGARQVIFLRRMNYPGTNGLILRRTYDELFKNHIDPMFRRWPFLRDWWSEGGSNGEKTLTFPTNPPSKQYFGYAQHLDDVKRYAGPEFADICPDEAALFDEEELVILNGSCRWSGPSSIYPKMILPFMPGGPGHAFLKRVMIDRDFQGQEDPRTYGFVRAYGWDNVEWAIPSMAEDRRIDWRANMDPEERKRIHAALAAEYYSWPHLARRQFFIERTITGSGYYTIRDKNLRDAWLDGSFEQYEGLVFPALSPEIHDLDRYTEKMPLDHLKLINSIDHASTGTTAMVITGVDPDENLFALEEYYERDRRISEHAKGMLALQAKYELATLSHPRGHKFDYTLIDPSTESKTLQNAHEMWSVQEEYRRHGISAQAAHRSHIEVGLDVLNDYLAPSMDHRNPFTENKPSPRLFISKRGCPNLWREMKEIQKKVKPNGEYEFIGSDHALDNLRYIGMSRPTAPARAALDLGKFDTLTQQKVRSEQKFFETFGQKGKPSNQHLFKRRA